MKKINKQLKNSFLKKKLIQICRFFGYEIIDQNSFEVPSLNKKLGENLSIMGKFVLNLNLILCFSAIILQSLIIYLVFEGINAAAVTPANLCNPPKRIGL